MSSWWAVRRAGLALVLLGTAGCAYVPVVTPDPAALPPDFAVVWDVPGSTDEDGAGPYFDTPSSPRLAAGPVLVAWWCAGEGRLAVAPGQVNHPPEMPPQQAPLAFEVACPTGGSAYVGWRRLAADALGGENALNIGQAGAGGAITYRLLFAQQAR